MVCQKGFGKISNGGIVSAAVMMMLVSACTQASERNGIFKNASLKSTQYQVKPGDSLWQIARGFGLSLSEIAALNKIEDPSILRMGQVLEIPLPNETDQFLWPALGSYQFDAGMGGMSLSPMEGSLIRASRSGRLVILSKMPGWGPMLVVEHPDGYYTIYAGLAELAVESGDFILQGSPIGILAKGPLYFEIRKEGRSQDVLNLLPRL